MKSRMLLLALVVLLLSSCSENPQVVLEKFIPILESQQCKIKPGGDLALLDGYVDVGLTDDYILAFEVVNYLTSTQQPGGSKDYPYESADAAKFRIDRIILNYLVHPSAGLNGAYWGQRIISSGVVVNPDESRQTLAVAALTDNQAADLRRVVSSSNFDWGTYPIIITVEVEGRRLGGGPTIRTNVLHFNLIPVFIDMIQSGSLYLVPKDGFPEPTEGNTISMEEYNAMDASCSFKDPMLNGCYPGQDAAVVNCYAVPGTADIIEQEWNRRYPDADGGTWKCCPPKLPEKPKEEQSNAGSGG